MSGYRLVPVHISVGIVAGWKGAIEGLQMGQQTLQPSVRHGDVCAVQWALHVYARRPLQQPPRDSSSCLVPYDNDFIAFIAPLLLVSATWADYLQQAELIAHTSKGIISLSSTVHFRSALTMYRKLHCIDR